MDIGRSCHCCTEIKRGRAGKGTRMRRERGFEGSFCPFLCARDIANPPLREVRGAFERRVVYEKRTLADLELENTYMTFAMCVNQILERER